MTGIRFVPQTGTAEDDPETRRSIRRHVMLGKNLGRIKPPKALALSGYSVFHKDEWNQEHQQTQTSVPSRVGSDLSFLDFADVVEPPLIHDTLRFCSASTEEMFVLEPCISFNSADAALGCLQALTNDALHLNVMVFGSQMFMNEAFWQATAVRRKSPRTASLQHYGKALKLLRERVVDSERRQTEVSDVTIVAIMTLATHALATGECEYAKQHLLALSRLVNVKSDQIIASSNKSKQLIELLRCDISISLATGQTPVFFANRAYESIFPLPDLAPSGKTPERHFTIMDHELARIWDVLGRFCVMVDTTTAYQSKLSERFFLDIMASVMYRLLHMAIPTGTSDEVVHLAMLCFCAVALLTWRQIRIPLPWLQSKCKHVVAGQISSHFSLVGQEFGLWYLIIYGIAFSQFSGKDINQAQPWLIQILEMCGARSYSDVEGVMGKFLWIDIACTRPAHKIVERTLASDVETGVMLATTTPISSS